MAVHGYVTHAAANRRRFVLLFAGYLLGFELVGAFALTAVLVFADPQHTILTDPAAYALRYALPVAGVAALLFWHLYHGHGRHVSDLVDLRLVERADEPRFVGIAEAQCTALGVRVARFGVVEAPEPNAMAFGTGARGLIAVTRGLLDALDDDELGAVLAHEASHIRNGDTRVLAANHALMHGALLFQTHNVLRVDNWRQLWLPLVFPPILVLMLAGGAATMLSLRYARWARRGVKLSRDHVADGEAVRVTHDPAGLVSALRKVGGRGGFRNSFAAEANLFDGPADREGAHHLAACDRIAAITALAGDLLGTDRVRRDTRATGGRRAFGQRAADGTGRFHFAYDADGRPLEEPPTPNIKFLWLMLTDRPAYRRWQHACLAWAMWREGDRRNALGIAPAMILPVAAVATFLLVLHWPADNDPAKLVHAFDPRTTVAWVQETIVAEMRFESGVSTTIEPASVRPAAAAAPSPAQSAAGELGMLLMPLMMMALIGVAIFRKQWLIDLFGGKPERAQDRGWRPSEPTRTVAPSAPVPPAAVHAGTPRGFGRRVT